MYQRTVIQADNLLPRASPRILEIFSPPLPPPPPPPPPPPLSFSKAIEKKIFLNLQIQRGWTSVLRTSMGN